MTQALTSKRVRLYPNSRQARQFVRFAGAARFAYNESLKYCNTIYEQEHRHPNKKEQREHLRYLRDNIPGYEWLTEIPEAITKQAIEDLDKAFTRAFNNKKQNKVVSKKRNKEGKIINPYGFPRFKKRVLTELSFFQRTDAFHPIYNTKTAKGSNAVKITGVKKPVKTKYRHIPEHVMNTRVSFDGKYWYLSWSEYVDIPEIEYDNITVDDTVGIDVGLKSLTVLSNGMTFKNPVFGNPHIRRLLDRKRFLQRRLSRKYDNNRVSEDDKHVIKTKNILKLEKKIRLIDRDISNACKAYKLDVINTIISSRPKMIVMEDLNVKGMFANKHLSKKLQCIGLGEFLSLLEWACYKHGIVLVKVDRFYPSTQLCSVCGARSGPRGFVGLGVREWVCVECGCVHERDVNASVNLQFAPFVAGSVCRCISSGSPMLIESSYNEIGDCEASTKVRVFNNTQKSCDNMSLSA